MRGYTRHTEPPQNPEEQMSVGSEPLDDRQAWPSLRALSLQREGVQSVLRAVGVTCGSLQLSS